ncbi:hypothetical protein [Aeromicrobium sp. CTD01-1L150]|uniref:hypothetical protein n=1 Tax=Aeromicrobium sp. CTD01-1L150 TaxID=3341830 RepID=UPI0035C1E4E2
MVSTPRPTLEVVAELRREVERIQGVPARASVPVHPALRGLLDVRAGGVYGVEAASLALLMMAGPSSQGAWCGIVGVRDLGVEAAAAMGVDPARTVVVPDPGARWLEVTAALLDALALVVVRPPGVAGAPGGGAGPGGTSLQGAQRGGTSRERSEWGRAWGRAAQGTVSERDAARVAARLRSRGSVLVPWGHWPGAEARLELSDVRWSGLGRGHGHLQARQATVAVHRGAAPARTRTLWLPGPDLAVRAVEEPGVKQPVGHRPMRSA